MTNLKDKRESEFINDYEQICEKHRMHFSLCKHEISYLTNFTVVCDVEVKEDEEVRYTLVETKARGTWIPELVIVKKKEKRIKLVDPATSLLCDLSLTADKLFRMLEKLPHCKERSLAQSHLLECAKYFARALEDNHGEINDRVYN